MKKLIILLFISVGLFSCNQEGKTEAKNDVHFKGNVQNAEAQNLLIKNLSNKVVDTIKLDDKGQFDKNINLKKGYYRLTAGKQYTWLYLEPGKDLEMNLDIKDFDKSITYKGTTSVENNYLAKKALLSAQLRPKTAYNYYGSLSEEKFVALQDSVQKVYNKLLDDNKIDNKEFVENEQLRHKLQRAAILSRFQMVKRYLDQNDEFTVSDKFPNPLDGINFDDDRLANLPNATSVVGGLLEYEMNLNKKGDEENDPIKMMQVIDAKIKNPKLREQLAYGNAKYDLMYTKDLDAFYALFNKMVSNPEHKEEIKNKYDNIKSMSPGKASPDFTAFDINGKEFHLKDFAGKPVYIDLWATWCSPCMAEMPALKAVEDKYKDAPITFISLDVYDDKAKWEAFVNRKKPEGVQLISTDRDMPFLKKYVVDGIPRFIFIDKEGKIIDANAPRPSDKKLIKLIEDNLD